MLKVYNTLTRKKEMFKPLHGKKVNFFVCGPTVYDYGHLGHAKTYVQFDVIVRYLRYSGYSVFYLMNITDVDDKIIKRANEKKIPWKRISEDYEAYFKEDVKALGINSVTKYARATDHIKEIESQVERLIKRGCAYKIADGWYFDLSKFPEYGKLAKRTKQQDDDAVSRIDENKEKRGAGDFCLWKFSKPGEPVWKSSLGDGRPGWHIEDTAITEKEFGQQYDVHGGAVDLIFPHHEAEITQMESISGKKPFVKYWLHTAFLNINKEKMSKSLGNFLTIRDVLKNYNGWVIRYAFVSNHYRTMMNFSPELLEQSKNSLERIYTCFDKLNEKGVDDAGLLKKAKEEFIKAMNDDFDTPKAMAGVFNFVAEVNKHGGGNKSRELLLELDNILGLGLGEIKKEKTPKEITKLAEERMRARENKDWKRADELRVEINNKGWIVEDIDAGYRLKKP